MALFRAALAAVLVLACSVAQADTCRQFFRQSYSYYAQPLVAAQVVYPPAYYLAGETLQQQAITQKAVREELRKLVPSLAAELRAGLAAHAQVQNLPPLPATATSVLAQHCAKCHSGPNPKAGRVYDGTVLLTCDDVVDALEAVRDGTMPKDHKLPAGVAADIMEELLRLRVRPVVGGDANAPPPPPPGNLE
jgi:hypothetical protein